MIPRIKFESMIKDGVYYMSSSSGATTQKAEGVIIGIVITLMAFGYTFEKSLTFVHKCYREFKKKYPDEYFNTKVIPESWSYKFQELEENWSDSDD